eukprot:tig00001003_g6260.t1
MVAPAHASHAVARPGLPSEEDLLNVDGEQPWESFEPFRSLGKGTFIEATEWADYAGEEPELVEPSAPLAAEASAVDSFEYDGEEEVAMVEEPAQVNANLEPLPISEVAPATSALYALNPKLVASLAGEARYSTVSLDSSVFTVAPSTLPAPAEEPAAPGRHAGGFTVPATGPAGAAGAGGPVSFVEEAPKMFAGRVEASPPPPRRRLHRRRPPAAGPLLREELLELSATLGSGRVANRPLEKFDAAKGLPGARVAPADVDADRDGRFDNFEYARLDADRNGAVSVREAAALVGRYLAGSLDGNGDGWVTFAELLEGLDEDRSGQLALDELAALAARLTAAEHERYVAQVKAAFGAYSQGGAPLAPGRLGALLDHEFRFAPGMLSLAFLEMDRDGDRAVSYDEYADAMEDLFATGALHDYTSEPVAE